MEKVFQKIKKINFGTIQLEVETQQSIKFFIISSIDWW